MVLEAVVVAIDNSEYMRNGDYTPSRYDAQYDACNLIFGRKSEDNPESALALVSTAGDKADVHVALTLEIGDVITALQKVKIGGKANFIQSLNKSKLVLLHKRNPNQGLRIVVFVGSPIYDKEEDIVSVAEQLKKHRVAVDLISFGETEFNEKKLEAFFNSVNGDGRSNLVRVPTGLGVSLSDFLRTTPILSGGGDTGGGDVNMGEFGINPNTDPDLYAVLQESMKTYQSTQTESGTTNTNVQTEGTGNNDNLPPLDPDGDVSMYSDDIEKAIALSLMTADDQNNTKTVNTNLPGNDKTETPNTTTPNTNTNEKPPDTNENMDQEELEKVLQGLDGVDINDPSIQSLITNWKKDDKKDEKKEDKK
jgi:26S proteasome regulatory subunit N10